jgi:single stranded DNA-binding protein (ssb)
MSVNKAILIGNVGKDPEIRYLDSGVAVATLTLATSERGFTTASGVQVPERTEWHNVVLWRGLAEVAEKYVKKGTQIYIEGKIRTRSYDDQNGVKRYVTEIQADVMQLLGKRENNGASADAASPIAQPVQVAQPTQAAPSQQVQEPFTDFGANGAQDDLPF